MAYWIELSLSQQEGRVQTQQIQNGFLYACQLDAKCSYLVILRYENHNADGDCPIQEKIKKKGLKNPSKRIAQYYCIARYHKEKQTG